MRAVTAAVNSDKRDVDTSNWLPRDKDLPEHVSATRSPSSPAGDCRWMESEHGRIGNLLTERCPGQVIALWPDAPAMLMPLRRPFQRIRHPPPVQPLIPIPPAGTCHPSYPTTCRTPASPRCSDLSARRFVVARPTSRLRQQRRRRRPRRLTGSSSGRTAASSQLFTPVSPRSTKAQVHEPRPAARPSAIGLAGGCRTTYGRALSDRPAVLRPQQAVPVGSV